MKFYRVFVSVFLVLGFLGCANKNYRVKNDNGPECSQGWPLAMSFVTLKNLGVYESSDWKDEKVSSTRVFSVKEGDRYKQMYKVVFDFKKEKKTLFVIHYADFTECSLTQPEMYLIESI